MLDEEKDFKVEFKQLDILGVYEDSKSCRERLDKAELSHRRNEENNVMRWSQDRLIIWKKEHEYGNSLTYECRKHYMYNN